LNRTKTLTLSNINILRSLRSVCYWREILPCFDFSQLHTLTLVACSYALLLAQ